MDTMLGIAAAVLMAVIAARLVIKEAHPAGAHRTHHEDAAGAEQAVETEAPPLEVRGQAEAHPMPEAPSRPLAAPLDLDAPSYDPGNGLVITAFTPPARPARPVVRPAPVAVPGSTTVDLLPGARVEVVEIVDGPAFGHPAVRPDPNRLIQTEIATFEGFWPRMLAFSRLVIGVVCLGVIFGVGVIALVRGIVAFFKSAF